MPRLIPVANVSDLSSGQMKWVMADNERLLLANVDGTFYAIGDRCGHQGASLSRGSLEGYQAECPRHFARFDVRTGKLISGPQAQDVSTYEVAVEEGTVYVRCKV